MLEEGRFDSQAFSQNLCACVKGEEGRWAIIKALTIIIIMIMLFLFFFSTDTTYLLVGQSQSRLNPKSQCHSSKKRKLAIITHHDQSIMIITKLLISCLSSQNHKLATNFYIVLVKNVCVLNRGPTFGNLSFF